MFPSQRQAEGLRVVSHTRRNEGVVLFTHFLRNTYPLFHYWEIELVCVPKLKLTAQAIFLTGQM